MNVGVRVVGEPIRSSVAGGGVDLRWVGGSVVLRGGSR